MCLKGRMIGMSLRRLLRARRVFVSIMATVVVLIVSGFFTPKGTPVIKDDGSQSYDSYSDYTLLQDSLIINKGNGCVIPHLDPLDEESLKFEKKFPESVCTGKDWVECFYDECFVSKEIQEELKVWFCVYRDIDFNYHLGPPTKLSADQKYKLTKSDLVDVSCFGTAFGSPDTPLYWSGHKAGLRRLHNKPYQRRARISVTILSLDSTSKSGFIRRMPKSYTALKEMGAFILNGYNVVGEGSMGDLLPITVGTTLSELIEARRKLSQESFVFHQLTQMGYQTALFEDAPFLGVYHQRFNVPVFEREPTDHFFLPLVQAVTGDFYGRNRSFCIEGMPLYGMLLNLTYQFFQLNGDRFSFTFITDMIREEFNMVSAADEDLAFFLHRIQNSGRLKNTVVFVMGNHGLSMSPIRGTPRGKLEERLPLMAIVLPERLKQSRPDAVAAMRANVDVLTTPFDIHTTISDILGIGDMRNQFKVPGADTERGMTLLKPIPASRSCGEAGVLPHWCACANWHPLSPHIPISKEIAEMVVEYINKITEKWREQCKLRKLVQTEYVNSLLSNETLLGYKNLPFDDFIYSNYYQVKVIVGPGRAIFDGTLRHLLKKDKFLITEPELSRLDPYVDAKESACIKKEPFLLHKYCYCEDYTENDKIIEF